MDRNVALNCPFVLHFFDRNSPSETRSKFLRMRVRLDNPAHYAPLVELALLIVDRLTTLTIKPEVRECALFVFSLLRCQSCLFTLSRLPPPISCSFQFISFFPPLSLRQAKRAAEEERQKLIDEDRKAEYAKLQELKAKEKEEELRKQMEARKKLSRDEQKKLEEKERLRDLKKSSLNKGRVSVLRWMRRRSGV